jgi:rod shape-determining protein MreC
LQQLATIQAENNHLKRLFHSITKLDPKAILGEISHMGRDPFSHIVVINRGSKHQILAGQAVVDADGVIGQVTRVYPFSSEVTMITDKNLSIPIQIERNQMRAIAFGEGSDNTLDLPFLPTNVDIKVGDKLVTSGIDGIYPAGLAVATVTKINQSPDSPFAKIICTPTAGVKNHLQLLILSLPEEPIEEIVEETKLEEIKPVAIKPKKNTPKKDLSKPITATEKPVLIKPTPNAPR